MKLHIDVDIITTGAPVGVYDGDVPNSRIQWEPYKIISNKDLPLGRGNFKISDEKNQTWSFIDSEIRREDDGSYVIIIGSCHLSLPMKGSPLYSFGPK